MVYKQANPKPRYSSAAVFGFTQDVFQDEDTLEAAKISLATRADIDRLWAANPQIKKILRESEFLKDARGNLYDYLNLCELEVFSTDSPLHPLEHANIREAVRTFRSLIGPINEKRTQFSALDLLWRLIREEREESDRQVSRGFILEFVHLFQAVRGASGLYSSDGKMEKGVPAFISLKGRQAALERSRVLDKWAAQVDEKMRRYPSGLEAEVIKRRKRNRARIREFFGGGEADWEDYHWHLRHVIRDEDTLSHVVQVSEEDQEAVRIARENRIPFGITPYYLALMDYDPGGKFDHAVRAQVIPPLNYVLAMKQHRADRREVMDFMGEYDTSPVDLVTRRYPKIAILKPYDTCAQICIYCQRNWEIEEVLSPKALAPEKEIDAALDWFDDHPGISDLLITGGDPGVMSDTLLDRLLGKISLRDQIKRIRIGTRTPVVLPFRITPEMSAILDKYHQPGRREISIVTHFEHPYEVTPEALEAVSRIRRLGIGVYNQEVFTVENSRRFESAALREALRLIGVDPYYNLNAKGKAETRNYRVPIARILQEWKEEARLLPGISRTDEPVFNVPRLGKNHLRAWQDHRVAMIMPDGRRVYEFHSWEKNLAPVPPYIHYDVPIYDYLEELVRRGEDPADYKTIWYYY